MSEDINNKIVNGEESGTGTDPQADPFQKTDSMLNAEGADLLSELAVASGDPIPEIQSSGELGSDYFDAVVDADGEIEGLLNDAEDAAPEDTEIPAVIAAASGTAADEGDMNKEKGSKGKRSSKDSKKAKGSSGKTKVRRRASFWQVLVRLFIFFLCVGIIGACALAVGATLYIAEVTADDYKTLNLDNIKLSLATVIMVKDSDTGEWQEHERIYSGENRVWVDYADFPDCLVDAIIASEDIRFRTHHGVDWKRTIFAFLNQFLRLFGINLADNIQGGSTLTQQLIKDRTNEKEVKGFDGILRKVREI
ncbi:MAG: transglycosylase domain-containing protein, partial [Oscillospiraceae bacterium]|nr:transglycosylase domain-containing protein [Oscillospiraceae bacterium]